MANAAARLRKKSTNHRVAGDLQDSSGDGESRFQIPKKRKRPGLISLSRRCRDQDSGSTHSVRAEREALGRTLTQFELRSKSEHGQVHGDYSPVQTTL